MSHVNLIALKPVHPPEQPRYRITVELDMEQATRIIAALSYWRESGNFCAMLFADMCGACQLRELLIQAKETARHLPRSD